MVLFFVVGIVSSIRSSRSFDQIQSSRRSSGDVHTIPRPNPILCKYNQRSPSTFGSGSCCQKYFHFCHVSSRHIQGKEAHNMWKSEHHRKEYRSESSRSASLFFQTRIQMEQSNPFRLTGVFNGVAGSLLGQVPYG